MVMLSCLSDRPNPSRVGDTKSPQKKHYVTKCCEISVSKPCDLKQMLNILVCHWIYTNAGTCGAFIYESRNISIMLRRKFYIKVVIEIHHWDENLPLWSKSLMWWKFINVIRINHCNENRYQDEIWWNSFMWWKIMTVMKIHNSDKNLSL